MMKSLDDRLASLARVAKDLNAVSDQVSDSFRAVEERLKSMGLGVEVELERPLPLIEDLAELNYDVAELNEDVMEDPDLVLTEEDRFLINGGLYDALADARADPDEGDPEVRGWEGRRFHLGYKKIAGTWRLAVGIYRCGWIRPAAEYPISADAKPHCIMHLSARPLLDCSRDIRLAAAGQIDDLLAAIERAAQERISRLQQSVAADAAAVGSGEDAPTPVPHAPGSAAGTTTIRRKVAGRTAR